MAACACGGAANTALVTELGGDTEALSEGPRPERVKASVSPVATTAAETAIATVRFIPRLRNGASGIAEGTMLGSVGCAFSSDKTEVRSATGRSSWIE